MFLSRSLLKSEFIPITPKVVSKVVDPITACLYSLDDYPFEEIVDYRSDVLLQYSSLFTSDREGEIDYPKTPLKKCETKYWITNNLTPLGSGYSMVFYVYDLHGETKYAYLYGNTIINYPRDAHKLVCVIYQRRDNIIRMDSPTRYYWFQKPRNLQYKLANFKLSRLLNNDQPEFDILYKSRHNVLQIYLCYMLGLTPVLDENLDLKQYGITSRLTPDFFEFSEDEDICLIGDISITTDPTSSYLQKKSKYSSLADNIRKTTGKIPILAFFCFDTRSCDVHQVLSRSVIPALEKHDQEFEHDFFSNIRVFHILRERFPESFERFIDQEPQQKIPFEYDFKPIKRMDQVIKLMNGHFNVENFTNLLKEDLDEEKGVFTSYKDEVFTAEQIEEALVYAEQANSEYKPKYRPTHYIPIPSTNAGFEKVTGEFGEQKMLKTLFESLRHVEHPFVRDVSLHFNSILNGPCKEYQWEMFTEGKIAGYDELRDEYHKNSYSENMQDYIASRVDGVPNSKSDRFIRRKVFLMSKTKLQPESQVFWMESGQQFDRYHPEMTPKKKKRSAPNDSINVVETFLNHLCKENLDTKIPDEITEENFYEHENVQSLAEHYRQKSRIYLNMLQDTYCHKYLRHNSLAYEQLIHFGNLSMSDNKIAVFNTGIPNICILQICNYRGISNQVGKPFIVFGIVDDAADCTPHFFGDVYFEKFNSKLFFCTGWRRLPMHRMEFFRDQYYSVLSTTMCSFSRRDEIHSEDLKGIFAVRTLVSLISNQVSMEKLADAKYAIMSSFSEYTNFKSLILEKFSPPYGNAFEVWLVSTMLKGLSRFRSQLQDRRNVRVNRPELTEFRQRTQESSGGYFNLLGLWSNRRLFNIQDVLDELFLYIHTPKEPSNIFHEEVKAVQTIQDWQQRYDKLPKPDKAGHHGDEYGIHHWLLEKPKIGFSSELLKYGLQIAMPLFERFIDQSVNLVLNEKIDELESTKAVVPDGRDPIEPYYFSNAEKKRRAKRVKAFAESVGVDSKVAEEYVDSIPIKERHPSFVRRRKVHDELRKYSLVNESMLLVNSAKMFLETEERVMADICIKAQYGGKREFYVMSMGSKVCARVVEQFYHNICRHIPNEMISVPGDRKLMKMQETMDRITYHAMKSGHKIMYINGDCTKWSASEVIETFYLMCDVMCGKTHPGFANLMKHVCQKWADKDVQVPYDVYKKVAPIIEETSYLKDLNKTGYKMRSKQNFLQGVFNYMSSFKAFIAHNLTFHLWKKMYPDSSLYADFLVHSDDYATAVSYKHEIEFIRYRSLQKICMKLCGMSDSEKKTNCQHYFMEFISLVCFNGSMSYPTIKKTKEVALTLPCESFKGDSDMVCARTGECVRVGTDLQSSWIFHRIHMYLLRRAYSLHNGGTNEIPNRFGQPVQLFGQSDMNPIFYFLCKGDPNNLRLYHYARTGVGSIYNLLHDKQDVLDTIDQFANPNFVYNNYNNRIQGLRDSTGKDFSESREYWESNLIYNFYRPKDRDNFVEWSLNMYFKSSFVKAYNKESRSVRMLRLSSFSKNKCVTFMENDALFELVVKSSNNNAFTKKREIEKHLMTINECFQYGSTYRSEVDSAELLRACLNGDSTGETIYNWLESSRVMITSKRNFQNPAATLAPLGTQWVNLTKSVFSNIFYLCDPKNYLIDFGDPPDADKCESDRKEFERLYPGLIDRVVSGETYVEKATSLQVIYRIATQSGGSTQVCMTKRRERSNLADFLKDTFKYMSFSNIQCDVFSNYLYHTMNPYTLSSQSLVGIKPTSSLVRLIVNNAGLIFAALWYRFDFGEQTIDSLRSARYAYHGSEGNITDILKGISTEQAFAEGMEKHEVITLGILNAYIFGDFSILAEVVNQRMTYGIFYDSSRERITDTGYAGLTVADYNFGTAYCKMQLDRDTGNMRIETNSLRVAQLGGIYWTGVRACGLISENVLSLKLADGLPNIPKIEFTAWENGMYFLYDKHFELVYRDKGTKCVGVPIMYKYDLIINPKLVSIEASCIETALRCDGICIYHGDTRILTMPYMKLYACDVQITMDTKDLDNELFEPQNLNFTVLKSKNHNIENIGKYSERLTTETYSATMLDSILYKTCTGVEPLNVEDLSEKTFSLPDLDYESDDSGVFDDEFGLFDIEESEMLPSQHPSEPYLPATLQFEAPKRTMHLISRLKNASSIYEQICESSLGLTDSMVLMPSEYYMTQRSIHFLKNTIHNKIGALISRGLEKAIIRTEWEDINGHTLRWDGRKVCIYKKLTKKLDYLLERNIQQNPNILWNRLPYNKDQKYGEYVDILLPKCIEKTLYTALYYKYEKNLLPALYPNNELTVFILEDWIGITGDDLDL